MRNMGPLMQVGGSGEWAAAPVSGPFACLQRCGRSLRTVTEENCRAFQLSLRVTLLQVHGAYIIFTVIIVR